jgi:hypothetical protein
MHRMRNFIAKAGLTLFFTAFLSSPAAAELIRQPAGQVYPDIAGAITGTQHFTYDPATRTGQFQASNTPYLLMLGSRVADECNILPNPDGVRSQVLNLTLDRHGRLLNSPSNTFALYGTVVVGGQTFQGLLLQGTPTAFGAQGRGAPGGPAFDLNLTITGGALARVFGMDVYMKLRPATESAFDGGFEKSFSTTIESSNTIGYHAPTYAPVPESTTLVVLLACGSWLAFHRRFHRIPSRALEACCEVAPW